MESFILLIETIVYIIGALFFARTNVILSLWIILVLGSLATWKKYNYSTARFIIFLSLFLITLCGNTNYLMFYAPIDFIITVAIVLMGRHTIPYKWKIAVPWCILVLTGIISGMLFAVDKTSYHVGVEVYVLLFLIILSSELLYIRQTINFAVIMRNICAINIGIVTLFFSKNTISELLVKPRALIYLLGENGVRSNTLAGIIVAFLVLLFFTRTMFKNIYDKVLVYMVLVVDVLILFFLQSRGAYVALATVIFVSLLEKIFVDKSFNKKDMIKAICAFTILIVLLFLPSIETILSKYVFARFFNRTDISNGRFDTYLKAISVWLNHPICGYGFLQYDALSIESADPHNFILGYLISTGIVGTLALVVFLIKVYDSKGCKTILNRALKYAVLAQTIHSLFEPVLTQNLPLSLFIVICVLTVESKRLGYIGNE